MKTPTFKTVAAALVVAASAIAAPSAIAHGAATAQHGGVVQTANDMTFELVATPAGALVYVMDHDVAYDAKQMSGKLTVLNGADKSEVALQPAGGNKLEANGVKLGKGAKAVASVKEGSKTMTVRFTVK